MALSMPKAVVWFAGVATMLALSATADAQFFSSGSPLEQLANHLDTNLARGSWVPYQAEFSAVSGYLQAAFNSRVGFPAVGQVAGFPIEAGAVSIPGASTPAIPQDNLVPNWLHPFNDPLPAADPGGSTPSNNAPERTNSPPSGLLARAEQMHLNAVTWLTEEREVLLDTPLGYRLFRPPRAPA